MNETIGDDWFLEAKRRALSLHIQSVEAAQLARLARLAELRDKDEEQGAERREFLSAVIVGVLGMAIRSETERFPVRTRATAQYEYISNLYSVFVPSQDAPFHPGEGARGLLFSQGVVWNQRNRGGRTLFLVEGESYGGESWYMLSKSIGTDYSALLGAYLAGDAEPYAVLPSKEARLAIEATPGGDLRGEYAPSVPKPPTTREKAEALIAPFRGVPEGSIVLPDELPAPDVLLMAGLICNNAEIANLFTKSALALSVKRIADRLDGFASGDGQYLDVRTTEGG